MSNKAIYIPSEPWETQEGWEKIVCQAVLDYPIAPREAKKILEVFGEAMRTTDLSAMEILDKILCKRL